ncbi:hypothetical protein BU17DRAFT_71558 [Hysterangium stoloniferum]|nr:hypothetical protein BU17DRAFT_71558 [Hysterangium stoloniferum]
MSFLPVNTARMWKSVSHISSSQQFPHEMHQLTTPIAPPWFQASVQQLQADIRADVRAKILPKLRRNMNQSRGDGRVKAYAIVPFTNGDDPTQLPTMELHYQ